MTQPSAVPAGDVLPDSAGGSLLLRFLPRAAVPYVQLARLDRPVGFWLLVLPCWWANAVASLVLHRPVAWWQLVLFLVGAIVMRGSGSTYNDIVDRELDAKVERTRNRPVASGRIRVASARVFLVVLALIGFVVVLQFNWFTIALGIASLAIVAIYPFAKRFTACPQFVLGLAFAWGGLVGWSAQTGALASPALLVYGAAVLWTIGYDTIYAVQDVRDDPAAGIKSSARLFGRHMRLAIALLYASSVVLLEAALIAGGMAGKVVAQAGVVGFAAHLGWQVFSFDDRNTATALRLFRSNRDAGLILFAGWALAAELAALGGTRL